MQVETQASYTAFAGQTRVASGTLKQVAAAAKKALDAGEWTPLLIFNDATSEPVEMDFRGTAKEVLKRISTAPAAGAPAPETPRGPGRPKLGVVAREVTLLPRHWDWLGTQPGGASVALRKLVEEARRVNRGKDRKRRAQEVAYRFMSAIAGNLPDFEDAARALFAGDKERFEAILKRWPGDVRDHAATLAADAFDGSTGVGRQ